MKILSGILLFIFCLIGKSFPQDNINVIHLTKLSPEGILLDKGWKFQTGDNPYYAKPDYDDSKWGNINPATDIYYLPQVRNAKICWFRLQLQLDSSLMGKPLALVINQIGASEIYLNGKLVKRFGRVSSDSKELQTFNPNNKPVTFQFTGGLQQVFAIRYAINRNAPYVNSGYGNPCFSMLLQQPDKALENYITPAFALIVIWYFQFGIYLLLTVIHLFFFIYYPARKVNLYFAIYTFSEAITFLVGGGNVFSHGMTEQFVANVVFIIAATVTNIFLIISVHKLFNHATDIFLKSIIVFCMLCVPFMFWPYEWGGKSILFSFIISGLGAVRISILAKQRKQPGAIVVLTGQLISMLFLIFAAILSYYGNIPFLTFIIDEVLFALSFLCPPVFISILLAREFAQTNITLKQQLNLVEKLSQKTIAQEKEKQEILATQNITLEKQVTQRTSELKQSLKDLKSTQSQLIQSEKMASLGELTAGIAHEIQNPLNFVNNFSEVNRELVDELKTELATGNQQQAIEIADSIKDNEEKINHHGKRADAIVKGMLQHSRQSKGIKEPTDINALADEYLRLSYHGMRAKDKSFNADFKTDFDTGIGKINIVPQDIGRVLLNLFNNAFYAVSEKSKDLSGLKNLTGHETDAEFKPTVSVQTKKINDKVEIVVRDNGNGISQNIVDKIFQPFFTTKPTGQGTGLGLSLAYDIITKEHGGTIKVESKEDGGSVFIIFLSK